MSELTFSEHLQEAIDHSEVKSGMELRWLHEFPNIVSLLEQRVAEFENDETPTRRELRLRRRQLDGIGHHCLALLMADDRFVFLNQLPAEWYALRDAIAITGGWPDDGSWMKPDDLDLLEEIWEKHGE